MLTALIAIFSFTACNKDDGKVEDKDPTDERFTKAMYTSDDYETLKDNETGLEWVNDTRGCFGGIVTPNTQCDETSFADLSDWRTPTPDEVATLMIEISSREMKLNYIISTCVLMSTSEDVWVFTENTATPGQKTTQKPGNAGLRCVRKFK